MQNGVFSWSEDFTKVFESWSIWVAIASAVILGGIKGWKRIKKSIKTDNFMVIHSEIHELLTELRVLTDAARTQVIQFHNGEYFMDGISMRKFSLTHESVEKGIESDGERVQGYLCSMFLPLLLLINENDPKIHFTVDLRDSYVKQYFESRNVEAFSVLPIRINNSITGFTMVQWCSGLKAEQIDRVYTTQEMRHVTNSVMVQLAQQNK
jgi:hypothetical protein